MPQHVAAIDQGTTSTRCIIFDRRGQALGQAQAEHKQLYPRAGWVEHDPEEIWQRTQQVIAGALAAACLQRGDLAAVGLANQRETTVVWDRHSGKPLHNAIVWQDTRTDRLCADLAGAAGPDRYRGRTGLPLATYFAGPKLRWLLDNVAGLRAAAESGEALFGTVDSYLVWWLTGGPRGGRHVTDVTNASRTLLMNLRTLAWDGQMLSDLAIPRQMLPEIRSSAEVYGTATGPLEGVPVAGILGDQQAALVGQTCFKPGEAKNTYGTGCFLLLNTGSEPANSRHGLLTTVAYRFGDSQVVYALEGSIAVSGALVQWLRDNLGLIARSADVEALADSVSDNGGVYFVPAFSGLFAPRWRPDARGVIVGLTRYANRGHIARAALEAAAYQTREVVEAMEADCGVRLSSLRVDGGMTVNASLLQFQADILGVPVLKPTVAETTALGAAYAAGLAVGFWSGLDELRENWAVAGVWQPKMAERERERLYGDWQRAVERSLGWA
ncbi:MAG: glycerol kinase GlpK [Chloroflexi bacterium]|nr:glycerol kinase GlpK [Chloroflexota bacterium]